MNTLKGIPIARSWMESRASLSTMVDRILAAKQQDARADVSELEEEIDELVYALYGLTKEEKTFVQSDSTDVQ